MGVTLSPFAGRNSRFGTVRPPITMMRWSGRSWEVEYHRSTWVLSAVSTQSHEPVGGQGVKVLMKSSHTLFSVRDA